MGNNTSSVRASGSAVVAMAKTSFSAEEQSQLNRRFRSIAHQADNITWEQFHHEMMAHLSERAQKRLFEEFSIISAAMKMGRSHSKAQPGGDTVCESAFIVGVHHLLTATMDERAKAIGHLAAGSTCTIVSHEQMVQYIKDLINSYVIVESNSAEFQTWRFSITEASEASLAENLIQELHAFGEVDSSGYTFDMLAKWLGNSCLILTMIDAVYRSAFNLKIEDAEMNLMSFPLATIPFCVDVDWHKFQTVLTIPSLLFVNQQLPVDYRRQWRLLFSSVLHGESFTKLARQIDGAGPCVLVVRSRNQKTFGGFASHGFVSGPTFAGDQRTFLFTLHPEMAVYWSSGYNSNFAYLNSMQQTIANGLGIGGNLEAGFWSLYLDSEYGKGKTQANGATFKCPQLAGGEHFDIDVLEVWGVRPLKKKTADMEMDEEEQHRVSVLDMDPEVKAMLEMTGKGLVSEGLRESDATASSPGEHQGHEFTFK